MIYKKPRDYGACFYEIGAKELTDEEKSQIFIDGKDATQI